MGVKMKIAVDMTPYIPGGANGGVVPLAVATIRELVARTEDEFYVIASEENYESLAFLDQPRITRCLISENPHKKEKDKKGSASGSPVIKKESGCGLDNNSRNQSFSARMKRDARKWMPSFAYNGIKRTKVFLNWRIEEGTYYVSNRMKPFMKRLLPDRLSMIYSARRKKHYRGGSMQGNGSIMARKSINLQKVTGEKMDLLYCPFTAVSLHDREVPAVSVLNDIQHKYCPWFFSPEEILVRDQFYNDLIRQKPYIISISEYTRKSFLEKYHYNSKKIVTIHCSVQNRLCGYDEKQDIAILNKYNLDAGEFIFYPANFWPHKNHRALFTAFGMLRNRRPDGKLKLVLTGAPVEHCDYWKDAAVQLGYSEDICFLGYVTDAELAALYRNCVFMVFPSLFEGFGMPVTEAFSMGTTVLCSNVTSLPEVGGECAFYFNPYDPEDICRQMDYVLDHPEEVIKKKGGYECWLQQFSAEDYIRKTRALFLKIAKKEVK